MPAKKAQISHQAEEYLEAIYRLQNRSDSAKTMDLAKKLNVVPGSITNTIENLEKRGLVSHKPYKGVKLTKKGRRIAANVLRKHRLAERLLSDFLHLSWSEVHDAACKLEHALSPRILSSIESVLGHPKTCPHGNPIPTKEGKIIESKSKLLTQLSVGKSGNIIRILEENSSILKNLENIGLIPGVYFRIEKKSQNGFLHLCINGKLHKLDSKIAKYVHIIPVSKTQGGEKSG
jgi:DtxR family Mn-dependent transcriptional regulator